MDIVDRFARSLNAEDAGAAPHVREFVAWLADRRSPFAPHGDDDVELRNYLMALRVQGVDRDVLIEKTDALRRFYTWALAGQIIAYSPFDEFNFDRPYLSRDQIRRRRSALDAEPRQRELLHLRALNQLADQLNRSADVQTALDKTLTALVDVMGLRAAWAFVSAESRLLKPAGADLPPHDFALAAACGLPPGLERDDCHYLRRPPDCHCQHLLRAGQLARAVNVVECTRLINSAQADGDNQGLLFHASAPIVAQEQVLGVINVATEDWQFLTSADLTFLSAVGAQVAAALERAQLYDETRAQRVRLERELNMAREVQAGLLPQRLPSIPGFSLAAEWRSAREVAGDFYDIFELAGGRWGLVVGDVSDKGAPAALYMAMVRSLIRSAAAQAASPARVLTETDRSLRRLSSSGMFVTLFYAVLEPAARRLTYANAGHNPPLVRRATGETQLLTRTGPLLGILGEVSLSEARLQLEPGDLVLAYTDGLTEACNAEGEEFGLGRAEAALAAPEGACTDVLASLLSKHGEFAGAEPQVDDITVLLLGCDG